MRITLLTAVICLLSVSGLMGQKKSKNDLSTRIDSISYALGMDVGTQVAKFEMGLNVDMLYLGLKDAIEENESSLSDDQIRNLLMAFQQLMQEKQMQLMQERAEKARTEGQVFLEKNQSAEGVQTTASGLQYKVVTAGNGPKPTAASTVRVHYEGRLINGEVFDSSYQRGEPIEFPVGGVIPGWTEALQLMPTGSKWQIFIPYNLAYGERGAPPSIGPFETLIFDVELLEVK
ncbi:MAG: peptidylprolyl isomerase [Bacteroidia bacterium]